MSNNNKSMKIGVPATALATGGSISLTPYIRPEITRKLAILLMENSNALTELTEALPEFVDIGSTEAKILSETAGTLTPVVVSGISYRLNDVRINQRTLEKLKMNKDFSE